MKHIATAFAVLTGIALVTLGPSRALAAALECDAKTAFLEHAKAKYGEIPAFTGKDIGNNQLMITLSPAGTWTLLMVQGDKLCFLAAGVLAAKPADGKPDASLPDAPALLRNGLRLISR